MKLGNLCILLSFSFLFSNWHSGELVVCRSDHHMPFGTSLFFLFLAVLAVNNHGVTHQEYLVIFLKRCVVL